MSKRMSMIALLGTVTLAAGCGSSHDATGAGGTGGTGGEAATGGAADAGLLPITSPPCVSGENTACQPSGFPFVQGAFARSDACNGICPAVSPTGPWTILFSQPNAGTLCMSGTDPVLEHTGFNLVFTVLGEVSPGHNMVLKRFNADLLGITQVRFTVDSPPSAGLSISADTLHSDVCDGIKCITFGFELPNRIAAAGTTTAPLVDFVNDPPKTFDTRALDAIGFEPGPGDFNFCVHDFHFLNAAGVEVLPPETDAGAGNGAVDGSQG